MTTKLKKPFKSLIKAAEKQTKKAAAPKEPKPKRICLKCKKAPVQFPRSKRCLPCQLEVRRLQLKRNNKAWMKRIAEGQAGHRLVYAGKPTEFAVKKYGDRFPKKVKQTMAAKKPAKANPFTKPAAKGAAKPKKGNPAKPSKLAPPFKKKAKASAKAAVKRAVKASKADTVSVATVPVVDLNVVPLAS